ncbi:hypothetical protein [Desulfobacter curvatus]|uniref:hypothetical protein n=1 Tax=Desulfobacter curvatus TaxID=2290 RepID=UPI0003746539|nr:hypothetical protein [Desulfobacter curvatus]
MKEIEKSQKKSQKLFIRVDENLLASYLKFMILPGIIPVISRKKEIVVLNFPTVSTAIKFTPIMKQKEKVKQIQPS